MKKLLSLLAVICSLTLITACATPDGESGGGIQETSKTLKQLINESQDGDVIDLGKEEIEIKDGDSYTIDKAITIKNGDAKYGTFTVESTGAKFVNLRNIESVIADEQLDDGDLDIRNCFEIDSVYVNGGGSHSIRIASTHIKNLYVAKEDVRVLLQAEGTNAAKVENVQISKNCKLESEDAAAVFEQVQISADVEKVTLAGSATVQKILAETVVTEESTEETKAKVEIESAKVKIDATSANVELKVSENADANVEVPKTQIIDKTFKVTTVVNGETSSLAVYEGYKFNFKPGDADSGFAGWYSDAAFTTKIELPYLVTKDVTLYAKFVELKAKFFVVGNGVASSAEANKYYSDVTVGKVEGATIATTSDYDVITVDNATATSDIWSVWADSLENWNFKANKNYKISVDVKADVESVVLLQAKPINASYANQKNVKVTTEWQTVEIETGCWNKDFLGYLQVVCGQSKKTYLKNLKMQEVSTKTIPTGVWGPNADSISVTQVENGVKFAFGKDSAAEWENGAAIRGTFVETSKNYLYKVKFTAAADENNVKFYYSADSWAEDNAWGSATIGKTATNIELYIPAYQLDGDELRGAEINISIPTKNSVTITNVKFESLTAIPSNQVIFFTSDYKVHKKITSTGKDNCVVLDVAANTEADLRFVMEKATNSKIEWNNSCSFSKFVNKTSATVSIPDGKDYLVLKNTSNANQSYRLYIDETWTIVIEDATTTPAVEYIVKYVDPMGIYTSPFVESETVLGGTVHKLPQLDGISAGDLYLRFSGWYEGVGFMDSGYPDMSKATKVASSYTVTKDVTLYAAWVRDHTLNFITGYESEGIIVDPIKTESWAKIDLPIPTAPDGMIFEGWYYYGDPDEEINWEYAKKASSPFMVDLVNDYSFYAKWKSGNTPAVEYTVKYVSTDYDYTGTFEGEKILSEGTQLELPQLDGIPDDDYPKRFGGWYEGVVMEPGDITPDMTNATKVTSPYTVTKDVTLYAVWVMDETITFVTGYEADGIIVDPIKTETYAKINLPTLTAPTGMSFEGWYCDGDNDDVLNEEWAEKVSSPYMVNRTRTLFAKWKSVDAPDFFANKAAVTQKDEYGNTTIIEQGICDSFYTGQANRYKYQDYIAGTVSGVSVTNSNSENIIKNTNYVSGTSTEWDYWLASTESFEMNANQNYEVSLEVKADLAQDVRFVLKDYYASVYFDIANVSESVTTEWQTIKFETGTLQADWKAFLEIPVGTIDSLYVRNLKVEAVDTNVLPVKSAKDSVISNRSENGFTVDIEDSSEHIMIPGIKGEYGNIYCVSFDVSATDETSFTFCCECSSADYSAGSVIKDINSTSTNVKAYVPHLGSNLGIGYNFLSLGFRVTDPTTVTISNFEVTTVDKSDLSMIPNVHLTTDWKNYAELTPCENGESFTTVVVEGYGQSGTIFAMAQDHWEGSFDWFTGAWIDLRTSIKADAYANFDLVVEGSEGRAFIYNRNDVASAYKIWINKNYEIVVEETSYEVTFDLNGGNIDGSTNNITIETVSLSTVKPSKDGYVFKGWTLTKDGEDFVSSATSDMTVYAKWVSPLQLFDDGDVVGDFAPDGQTLVFDSDKQVYETSFIYSSDMNAWLSPLGTVEFKFRPIAGDWNISYGPINEQPVLDGEEVEFGEVSGGGTNLSVSGLVEGTTYKIEVRCTEEGKFFVKVSTVTE